MPIINTHVDSMNDANNKKFIMAFYIVFTIGLTCISHKIGSGLGNVIANYLNGSIQYRAWAKTCLEFAKPSEILSYLLPVLCLSFYYFFACLHLNGYIRFHNPLFIKGKNSGKIIFYGFLMTAVNLYLLLGINYHFGLILWGVLFLFPFLKKQTGALNKKYIWMGWGLLIVLLLFQSITILWPYGLRSVPFISNDYMDIPEQTIIGQNVIDNINFINQHRIGGLLKYDPRLSPSSQLPLAAGEDYIKLPKTPALSQFIAMHTDNYRYDDLYGGLFVTGQFTSEDSDALCKLIVSEDNCNAITYYYQFHSLLNKRAYDSMEAMFIKLNQYEIDTQSVAGHYFHHQHAFLGPINEYRLGKPVSQTMFLYGWLNTIVLSKWMSQNGVINFTEYLKITYLFYPLYFLMIALISAIIFRNLGWVFLVVILSLAGFFAMGFEAIRLAPGFNPIRHFFDLFVLLSWYGYLFARRNNVLYLGIAVGFCIIAYLACKEFGLFMFVGLIATYFLRTLNRVKPKITEMFILLLGVFAICAAFVLIKVGSNPNSIYYFSGVTIPPTSEIAVWFALSIISIGYIFLLLWQWKDNRWKFLALFLFIYLQLSLIYYIWYSDKGHLLIFSAMWSFFGAIVLKEFLSSNIRLKKLEPYIVSLLIVWVFVSYYLPLSMTYIKNQYKYLAIFNKHKVYYWDIPTAKFYSTMDPAPFYDAIKLINKYSNKNGIYIISKYDNSLPFFSRKYNEMPFLQTDLSIVSRKELQIEINDIIKAKPEYLFVDSDIERNRIGDVCWPNDPFCSDLYFLGHGRALVLDNLSALFAGVREYYQPIERGQLITVYQLKVPDVLKG